MTARRLVRLAAALLLAAAGFLPPVPGTATAASATFGQPEARAAFGQSITFTVPITVRAPLARVEVRLRYPGSLGPFIEEVAAPSSGSDTLQYVLVTAGGGHLVPNTTIEATWVAVPADGGAPVLSRPTSVRYSDDSQDWRTLRGDVVTVHWHAGDAAFARQALAIGERAVRETADLLGVTETEPIDFFIYGSEAAFRSALGPGTRENVGGQAHADIRTLFALITPDAIDDAWVGIVIPHELVHLVFDTAVDNPYRFPPRWVNEGLAVYLSEGYGPLDRSTVEAAVADRELLPLTALTGQFPTEPDRTYLAYAEAVSAIDHLVRISDRDTLFTLIASYREGLTDDEAFERALGRDVAAFQAGWLDELGAAAPEAFGPVPNPPGPVPPGWQDGAPPPVPPEASPAGGERPSPGATPPSADVVPLLAAVTGVVLVVLAGLAIARRRTAER